jgi:hypothetical protein
MRSRSRYAFAVVPLLLIAALAVPWHASRQAMRLRLGERIYRDGVLPSGALLRGVRPGLGEVSGAQAACVQCHRRSGMGTVEGGQLVPPIAGPFLFQPRAQKLPELDGQHTRGPDLAHALGRSHPRAPYDDRSLQRAICQGTDPTGSSLEALMPRYNLSDSDAQLLVDYLKQLSTRPSPGVTADSIHFATVVTPGVAPQRRKAMLDVLQSYFSVHNGGSRLARLRQKPFLDPEHGRYRAWELHVWELTGPPSTWEAQLLAYERRQPVFALISGVGERTWAPVQQFCEKREVPCWFPTVDLPVTTGSFYSVYFSKGVLLEAEMLARRIGAQATVRRLIEVRTDDEAAAGATRALAAAIGPTGMRLEERVLHTVDRAALQEAVADATAEDALVLWLRGDDLALLAGAHPPPGAVYLSATMAGAEHAPLPAGWKAQARLIYPFELPRERSTNLSRFHSWLATHGQKLVDERLQADAYLASALMSEQVGDMLEVLNRDYLLERAEALLSAHLTPAMYHRLSLGPTQRFASKGGYIARFDGTAESGWIVP